MDYESLFISDKDTILIRKKLVKILGDLNEAIVLNQLNYWINLYKKSDRKKRDGKYWVYNSYKNWVKDNFDFWSATTVKRTFTRLEKKGIVVSSTEYNKSSIDKTKWYSIDYEKLQQYIDEYEKRVEEEKKKKEKEEKLKKGQNETISNQNEASKGQNDPTIDHNGRAIPEITDNNYKGGYPDNNIYASFGKEEHKQHKRYIHPTDYTEEQLADYIEDLVNEIMTDKHGLEPYCKDCKLLTDIIVEFYREYEYYMSEKHKILSTQAYENIIDNFLMPPDNMINGGDLIFERYEIMIDKYFELNYNDSINKSLSHFFSNGIMENLYYKTMND